MRKSNFIAAAVVLLGSCVATVSQAAAPIPIAEVVNGHIHPAACISLKGTIVVTYGRVNHTDLRVTRSTDGGQTWSEPTQFTHTVGKTYYPGSLTTLRDGRLLHAWNRWSTDTNQAEPRSVLYSFSSDDGLTWSEPKVFPRDSKVRSIIRHPVIELPSGRWLAALDDVTLDYDPKTESSKPFGDGRVHGLVPIVRTPKGTFVSGKGLRSTDEGRTWQEIAKFPAEVWKQGWRHEMIALANGWLLASQIPGPGVGGEKLQYVVSFDDGLTWDHVHEYYNPGRPIGGRACPRTIQLDADHLGVVFYDTDAKLPNKNGQLFFLKLRIDDLK